MRKRSKAPESMGKEGEVSSSSFCFTAPPNSEEALAVYEKYQILHIKGQGRGRGS